MFATEQRQRTLSRRGIRPAVRITANAPTGRTHAGASTVPGSAVPAAAINGATDCNTLVTPVDAAGRGATMVVLCRAGVTTLDSGGATTNASAAGARQRRAVVADKSCMMAKSVRHPRRAAGG